MKVYASRPASSMPRLDLVHKYKYTNIADMNTIEYLPPCALPTVYMRYVCECWFSGPRQHLQKTSEQVNNRQHWPVWSVWWSAFAGDAANQAKQANRVVF